MSVDSHNSSQIIQAVAEAATWCELHWNQEFPRTSLRTVELSPELLSFDRYHSVSSVIWKRKKAIKDQGIHVSSERTAGQILVYEPDANLFDGLGQSESGGYLDFYDCPPWDTWVGLIRKNDKCYLVCWVPQIIVPLVNNGAEVICSDCIKWLNDVQEPWAEEIKTA